MSHLHIPCAERNWAVVPIVAADTRNRTQTLNARKVLDECVLRIKHAIKSNGIKLPYCAFNGGQDCWLDVGNKRVGVEALQVIWKNFLTRSAHCFPNYQSSLIDGAYDAVSAVKAHFGVGPAETLHIGDQFLNTGNDISARSVATTVWVTDPDETRYLQTNQFDK